MSDLEKIPQIAIADPRHDHRARRGAWLDALADFGSKPWSMPLGRLDALTASTMRDLEVLAAGATTLDHNQAEARMVAPECDTLINLLAIACLECPSLTARCALAALYRMEPADC